MNPELNTALLVRSLRSRICPACGRMKKANQTPCVTDYRALSAEQQRALYRRVGNGYEGAFADAMQTLNVTTPTWPPDAR